MIGRYLLTALVAGLIAGAVLTGLQIWRLSPLIAAAEVYEKADEAAEPQRTTVSRAGAGKNRDQAGWPEAAHRNGKLHSPAPLGLY